MYMNIKPNKHKRITFNTTTMTSLGFTAPPLPKILGPPLNLAPPPPPPFPPNLIFLLRSYLTPTSTFEHQFYTMVKHIQCLYV